MERSNYRKSSEFYRLEKSIGDGYLAVAEFHTVVNGNIYYVEHEENESGRTTWIGKEHRIPGNNKEVGNKIYLKYKKDGYKFAGRYEMDIMGYKTKIWIRE